MAHQADSRPSVNVISSYRGVESTGQWAVVFLLCSNAQIKAIWGNNQPMQLDLGVCCGLHAHMQLHTYLLPPITHTPDTCQVISLSGT